MNEQLAQVTSHAPAEAFDAVEETAATLENIAGNPAKGKIGKPLGPLGDQVDTMRVLSNGFIVTSLLWAAALAFIIDHRLWTAATYFAIAAGCSFFGIMHSPFENGKTFLPWQLDDLMRETPVRYALAYLSAAVLMIAWGAGCDCVPQFSPKS